MGSIFKAVRRGFAALAVTPGPSKYEVVGKLVKCAHCGAETFTEGDIPIAIELRFASTLMCSECGRIEWFGQEPTKL